MVFRHATSRNPRVAVVSAVVSPRQGGPAIQLARIVDATRDVIDYRLFGVVAAVDSELVRTIFPQMRLFRPCAPRRWFYAPGLQTALNEEANSCDVFHAHMLWDYPVWAARSTARRADKPLVVSPHGSLIARWRQRSIHKAVYKQIFLRRFVRDSTVVHVLNKAEAAACLDWGLDCPMEIIPNGLPRSAFSEPGDPEAALSRWRWLRGRRVLLFLGRIAREKGIDLLLEAWQRCKGLPGSADWILVIAGPDYRGYARTVEDEIRDRGLTDSVFLVGPVWHAEKRSLLAASECFVLPSRSEAMSVAVLEAMAAGLPAIVTRECNMPELASAGGGWEVPCAVEELSHCIARIMRMTPEELRAAGERGRQLGLREYTLEGACEKFITMYRRLARC
jgi:glycosyltransferase involved in cell wall biosynthesis